MTLKYRDNTANMIDHRRRKHWSFDSANNNAKYIQIQYYSDSIAIVVSLFFFLSVVVVMMARAMLRTATEVGLV